MAIIVGFIKTILIMALTEYGIDDAGYGHGMEICNAVSENKWE